MKALLLMPLLLGTLTPPLLQNLLSDKTWLSAKDLAGEWSLVSTLPKDFSALPKGDQWDHVKESFNRQRSDFHAHQERSFDATQHRSSSATVHRASSASFSSRSFSGARAHGGGMRRR